MMCGKRNFGDDWVHLDAGHDVLLSHQFNSSIDLIYCSHGIAYFMPEEIKSVLKIWFKKLRNGAVLRLSTPDWEALRQLEQPLLGPLYGRMRGDTQEDQNWIYHRTVYTFESLHALLTECGFINTHRYDHTKTEHPNTGNREDKYDDHSAAYYEGNLISLNVQCYKP